MLQIVKKPLYWVLGLKSGALVIVLLYKLYKAWVRRKTYDTFAKAHRDKCHRRLQDLEGKVNSSKLSVDQVARITALKLSALITKLQSGEVTARDVLQVFQQKALSSHKKTNCLVEPILEADKEADHTDQLADKSKPLHGVPISIKECVSVQGYISSIGIGKACIKPKDAEWDILKILKEQGAIAFVRTGGPQLLLSYEGSNPIFGNICHPLDASRIPGGSSSGEGALIADGGSLLGIGTDIGGSVRAPAAMCGICALKPSRARMGPQEQYNGQNVVRAVAGPMARDVEGLVIAMKCILVPRYFEMNPDIPPVPFQVQMYEKKQPLTIGYYVTAGQYPATPASARAVLEAKQALEQAGHTLVPWDIPDFDWAIKAMVQCFKADGGKFVLDALNDEPVDPTIRNGFQKILQGGLRRWLRTTYYSLIHQNTKRAEWMNAWGNEKTVPEWWDHVMKVAQYREMVYNKMKSDGIDALLSPTLTATKYGQPTKLLRLGSYYFIYNLLDWPAGVVPVTKITKEDIQDLKDYHTGDDIEHFIRKDQEDAEGLPVAVQCAAGPWKEELVLRILSELEQGLRG